jgi:hypothetical protein
MCKIRFNLKTKEIEIAGPESFVDAYFNQVEELAAARHNGKKQRKAQTHPRDEKPLSANHAVKTENAETVKKGKILRFHHKPRENRSPMQDVSLDMKSQEPPVRRYILRKAGTSITRERIATLANEDSGRVSIESLKEKLGVTEQQIAGILREAEKQGRVRRDADGSYVWL